MDLLLRYSTVKMRQAKNGSRKSSIIVFPLKICQELEQITWPMFIQDVWDLNEKTASTLETDMSEIMKIP